MNKTKAGLLPIEQLRPFEAHPFQVRDDESMEQLVESIRREGIMTPILVRPLDTGEYEIISGHRRVHACRRAGIEKIPALIRDLGRDAAAIALVDSNLHREHILPSEKAFAYKMKMEAMNRQGQRTDLTSSQPATKSDSAREIGKASNESRDTVFRYIRLTRLVPELLQKVDEGRIALTPATELSYLTEEEQANLLDAIEYEDCTPSLSQAVRLRKFSREGRLSKDVICAVMSEQKPNQKEQIRFRSEDLRKYFPRDYTEKEIRDDILKLLDMRQKKRERQREAR